MENEYNIIVNLSLTLLIFHAKFNMTGFILVKYIDLATMASMSVFVLFVALVKAFDRVVREIVFGFPDGTGDPRAYLLSLGLTNDKPLR